MKTFLRWLHEPFGSGWWFLEFAWYMLVLWGLIALLGWVA